MDTLRLFIAVDTPADIKKEMEALSEELARTRADVRWDQPQKFHCTLQFLGNVSQPLLDPIVEAVRGAARGVPPLRLQYRTIGFFPDRRRARIVWIGMDDLDGTLALLHGRIAEGLLPLGFPREERPFHPHVTLGRVRSDRRLRELIASAESRTFEHPPVTVHQVDVVRSQLLPSGSVYTLVGSIAFPS